MTTNTLDTAPVQQTLNALHEDARSDWKAMLRHTPRVLWGLARGKGVMQAFTPEMASGAYLPVSRDAGRLLNTVARATGATHIVEFGTSFGLGTIYLAAAAKDNGGHVITTEIEPNKVRAARANIERAALSPYATVREGDALQTLTDVEAGIDLVFLDGWKDLYNDVLDLLLPRLAPGAVVVGDNIELAEAKDYYRRVSAPDSGFVTARMGREACLSCYLGPDAPS
ncbi:MAG: class I SAM-dependent methyltransferase [Actinomycetota bacterium]